MSCPVSADFRYLFMVAENRMVCVPGLRDWGRTWCDRYSLNLCRLLFLLDSEGF